MIIKQRAKPIKVPFCEALTRRLNPYHPKLPIFKNEIGSYTSGYYGEKSLDYYLDTLDPKKYHIFHGLRLKSGTYPFQLDTLIQTMKYHFILEIKNLTGELLLDTPLNQLIQTKGETQEVYPCPILQAERQQFELQKWLHAHNFPNIPVEKIVVFTNKKAYLKTHPGNEQIFKFICKSPGITNRIKKLDNLYPNQQLNEKEMKKLGKLLLNNHLAIWSYTLLAEYNIDKYEILIGVICPTCGMIGMLYQKRTWVCSNCQTHSKTAHEPAIRDYFLLINSTITNQELREFLQLPNGRVANRILKSMNLRYTGDNKARVYHAPREYPYFQ